MRAMDYLYEREINSNKGSLKSRRKQFARIKEKREGERANNVRRCKKKTEKLEREKNEKNRRKRLGKRKGGESKKGKEIRKIERET